MTRFVYPLVGWLVSCVGGSEAVKQFCLYTLWFLHETFNMRNRNRYELGENNWDDIMLFSCD